MIHTQENGNRVSFFWNNNVFLGYAYREIDGFYVFTFEERGVWSDYALRHIADKLTELNKEWNEQIERELGGENGGGVCEL